MGLNYLSIPKLKRLRRWNLGKNQLFHSRFCDAYKYFSMIGLKLNRAIKGADFGKILFVYSITPKMIHMIVNRVSTLRPERKGWHFAGDLEKSIILSNISINYIP